MTTYQTYELPPKIVNMLENFTKGMNPSTFGSSRKIPMIKYLREYSSSILPKDSVLGLKSAKDMVEKFFTNSQLYPTVIDIPEMKPGDIVLVQDRGDPDWTKAIFVAYEEKHDYPYICASLEDDDFQLCFFEVTRWNCAKKYLD